MAGHDASGMVSGTDEHGTPILVAADKEGLKPKSPADRNNRLIVEELVARPVLRPVHVNDDPEPRRRRPGDVHGPLHTNGYIVAKTTLGAISPSTGRTLPDHKYRGAPA